VRTWVRAEIEAAAQFLLGSTDVRPKIALVLGSGLGALAEQVTGGIDLPAGEIPGWPASTVEGHAGRVRLGQLEGHPTIVQQGRCISAGYSMPRIGFPIRVMQQMGVEV
jgi:purine-nucleoside phosphorylase